MVWRMSAALLGRLVRFRIRDVHVPEPAELLARLHENDMLEGRVADFSDSGEKTAAFAVVEIPEFEQPVVIRTEALQLAGAGPAI
jgi:hypothetical protein